MKCCGGLHLLPGFPSSLSQKASHLQTAPGHPRAARWCLSRTGCLSLGALMMLQTTTILPVVAPQTHCATHHHINTLRSLHNRIVQAMMSIDPAFQHSTLLHRVQVLHSLQRTPHRGPTPLAPLAMTGVLQPHGHALGSIVWSSVHACHGAATGAHLVICTPTASHSPSLPQAAT